MFCILQYVLPFYFMEVVIRKYSENGPVVFAWFQKWPIWLENGQQPTFLTLHNWQVPLHINISP